MCGETTHCVEAFFNVNVSAFGLLHLTVYHVGGGGGGVGEIGTADGIGVGGGGTVELSFDVGGVELGRG